MFNQNLAHQLCRHAEKMLPALPFGEILFDQPQVGLIDKRGRLQRVIGSFAAEIALRQLAQFPIDDGQQLGERRLVALAPAQQQHGDFVGRRHLHKS